MNCPICDAKGCISDSRRAPDNQTMRRYRCVAGHKWKTLEVLDMVYDKERIKAMRVEQAKKMTEAKGLAYATRL
jgi:transcriptional regulator NrdR family protein